MKSVPQSLREDLSRLFETTRCIELVQNQQLRFVRVDDQVSTVCRLLATHKISSVPVFDETTQNFVGLLDYRDIVDLVLLYFRGRTGSSDLYPGETGEILNTILQGNPIQASLTVDLSKKNPFHTVLPESPLLMALDIMKTGVHRICVMDAFGKIVGVLSQTDILKLVASKSDIMKELGQFHVSDLDPITESAAVSEELSSVSFVYNDDNLFLAFTKMSHKNHSSIAVVDHAKHIIGTISAKDIQHLLELPRDEILQKSCEEFISRNLLEEGLKAGRDPFPYFGITKDSTISHAIRKILAVKVHRIWVVEDGSPTRVVSMTELCSLLGTLDLLNKP